MEYKDKPDTLTDVLLGLRLDGVEYGRCVMHQPWAVAFHPRREASFYFVAQGDCWLHTQGSDWRRLKAGDALLLPRSTFHVLASCPDVPCVDVEALARQAVSKNIYLVNGVATPGGLSTVDGETPSHTLFCGTLRFNIDPMHPLLAMMPDIMHADDLSQRDPAVPALLEAMEREVTQDRIGACGILARLADVLAASIIRAWVECACSKSDGWIAALRCPQVGRVLAAIHKEPGRDWSVTELATLMGVSRSSFIDKFSNTVGDTPARYVARVKMFQARHWIAHEGMRVSAVANRLGYDSEASFSRAFKRVVGHPPSQARVN